MIKKTIVILVLVLSLLLVSVGCSSNNNQTPNTAGVNETQKPDKSADDEASTSSNSDNDNDAVASTSNDISDMDDDAYILPWSDKEACFEKELNLDKAQLRLARNEIYARYGYIFKDAKLKEYFNSKSWYKENNSFNESLLNPIEQYNIEYLLFQEKRNDASKVIVKDKQYKADINKDGTIDTIKFDMKGPEDGESPKFVLTINGISVKGQGDDLVEYFGIIDLDSNDKYKEICVGDLGPSDDLTTRFYHYDGKTLKLVGTVPGLIDDMSTDGEGTIYTSGRFWSMCTFDTRSYYKLSSKGIEPYSVGFYAIGYDITVSKSIPMYKTKAYKDIQVKLKPNEKVKLLLTDDKGNFVIRNSNGVIGWINDKNASAFSDLPQYD